MMQNECDAKRMRSSLQNARYMEDEILGRKIHFHIEWFPIHDIQDDNICGEVLSPFGNSLQCIKAHFAGFGELVSVHLWFRTKSLKEIIGIIQFKETEDAKRVLQCRSHDIQVGQIRVCSRVDDAFDFLEPRQTRAFSQLLVYRKFAETVIDSHDDVHILDDDCLQEIFDYLNAVDLCSVAEVCPRFKAAAQKQFEAHHKSLHFVEIASLDKDQMVTFMQNFGPFIVKLDVSKYLVPKSIQAIFPSMLGRHFCSLRELRLHDFIVDDATAEVLRPILVRLEMLKLHECRLSNTLGEVIANCNKLTKIKITLADMQDFHLRPVQLPKLESVTFSTSTNSSAIQNLPRFLECNPQLRKVALMLILRRNDASDVIRTIARLEHVESLKFIWLCYEEDNAANIHFPALTRLTKLRKLKISQAFGTNSVDELLVAMASAEIPLEHLEMNISEDNELIPTTISTFKSLKVLSLFSVDLEENDFLCMCESLPELTDLYVRFDEMYQWDLDILPELLLKGKKLQQIRLENFETPIPVRMYDRLLKIAVNRSPLQMFVNIEAFEELRKCTSMLDANANILRISRHY